MKRNKREVIRDSHRMIVSCARELHLGDLLTSVTGRLPLEAARKFAAEEAAKHGSHCSMHIMDTSTAPPRIVEWVPGRRGECEAVERSRPDDQRETSR